MTPPRYKIRVLSHTSSNPNVRGVFNPCPNEKVVAQCGIEQMFDVLYEHAGITRKDAIKRLAAGETLEAILPMFHFKLKVEVRQIKERVPKPQCPSNASPSAGTQDPMPKANDAPAPPTISKKPRPTGRN